MNEIIISEKMPVIALRGLTVFPGATMHFDVAREKSIRALDNAMSADQRIFFVTQKQIEVDDPKQSDLYSVGTVARVRQILKLNSDAARILIVGEYRAKIVEMKRTAPFLCARVESLPDQTEEHSSARIEALTRISVSLLAEMSELAQQPIQETMLKLMATHEPGEVADIIGQAGTFGYDKKMKILSELHPARRLELAVRLLTRELGILHMESELHEQTQQSIDRGQREYYLREQMKIIRNELGENDEEAELEKYSEKLARLHLSDSIQEKLKKEIERLAKQPYSSAEAAVIRSYLDAVLELPWNKETKERLNVAAARKILDADHFGLEKVKERILEALAVRQLQPQSPCRILCLVGPPGIGKTSIAMSVARALNRKLARISLGGIHDEAEIRGHRKTYIGAMPGRIMTAIAQAGTKNPLLLLDEIDKLGSDYRGDPSAALLEVLDGEQNVSFRDNYLEVPFDLSGCMFITTANTTDTIPRPLLDRMDVIELSSYTDEEKLMIAKRHLLPKQLKLHGLRKSQLKISDSALREVIYCYTRESGVRNLEREIGNLCRKTAMRLVEDETIKSIKIDTGNLDELLGPRKILPDRLAPEDTVGLVTGLAWTAVGGETLEIECSVVDGSGKLELTGNLGEVMKESAHAAMTYIRSRAGILNLPTDFYKTKDIHVHFPEGAVPKDGPSAGIAVCTAIVSALMEAPVRRDIAMTGEISIRGRVLPIGGLKEKTMAALRHGVKTVIIPKENEKDLREIDPEVRSALNFLTVEHVDAVLDAALVFPFDPRPDLQRKKTLAVPMSMPRERETGLRQ